MRSLEPHLRRVFEWYGHKVYRHRLLLIVIPICITAGMSYGLMYLEELQESDTEYTFTPSDGAGKTEYKTFTDIWPLDNDRYLPGKSFETKQWVDVIVTARDAGNMLRPHVLNEVLTLDEHITQNISIKRPDYPQPFTYQVLCLTYAGECMNNGYLNLLAQRYSLGKVLDLRYPRGGNGEVPMYLGTAMGGVKLHAENQSIESANSLRLFYFLVQSNISDQINSLSQDWRFAVEKYLRFTINPTYISIAFSHYDSLAQGLEMNAERFTPNVITSFIVLLFFALICSFVILPPRKGRPFRGIDWVRSKPYLAMLGVLSPGMAILTTYGMLLLLRMPFNAINTVMPFLVVSIGVDDMFILLSAWHRSTPSKTVSERISETLGEGAVSITITSLTDALSFAIGCYTTLPGVQIFCAYTTVAIVIDYIYQLTFFLGIMSYIGDMEHNGRHAFTGGHVVNYRKSESSIVRFFCRGTNWAIAEDPKPKKGRHEKIFAITVAAWAKTSPENLPAAKQLPPNEVSENLDLKFDKDGKLKDPNTLKHESRRGTWVSRFFRHYYGPVIIHPATRVVVLLSWSLYMTGAVIGCLYIKEGLNPQNLVPKDHYVYEYFVKIVDFWALGPQLHILVENPGNLTSFENREQIWNLLEEYENMKNYSVGRTGSMFWLLAYSDYMTSIGATMHNTSNIWEYGLLNWLETTGGRVLWATDMIWMHPNNTRFDLSLMDATTSELGLPTLEKFRFQVCLQNYLTPNDHKQVALEARAIAAKYAHLNVTTYEWYYPFADQYIMIVESTLRNIGVAMLSMMFVAFLLIPSLPCVLIIVLCILSIDLGVIGYMTWWGVNLDAVSMIGIIMSIGFAVDLSAHISYAYVTADGSKKQRVVTALETLGWPVFQGALSSIIGMLILSTVDAYIILTFFKTMFLVIGWGLLHGLIFLPVALTVLLPQKLLDHD